MYYASLLHDSGRIYINDLILKKEGEFNDDELNEMRKHPSFGYSITRGMFCNINELNDIPDIIKHHHERIDGTGYPDKLKGEEIPFYSRLICVSDAVDAMLSKRSYKENIGVNYVISELIKNKDKQFDGRIFFDDKSHIDVTGKVDNILKIGSNIYCQFRYINLLESTRDKIFAQIFRKQRQLKKI